ncbi:hypothetical protein PG997_001995 [Apiospora hydei]|uniref:Uncharacterized protein n=1 Tax=Apiospora hydei TaxID=1337664 RepID=A0ABR1X875_9PEZI
MKATFFIAPLLAAVATAAPAATARSALDGGRQMLQYCDGENLQGDCVTIYGIDVGVCSWSSQDKIFYAGVSNVDGIWATSAYVSCFEV